LKLKKTSAWIAIITAYPPDIGRLSEYAKEIIEAISQRINGKILILSDRSSLSNEKLIIKNSWKPNSILGMLKLWLAILTTKCKLMHFNLHLAVFGSSRIVNFLGLTSTLLAKLSGKKVIITLHNIPDAINLEKVGLKNSLLNRIGLAITMRILIVSAEIIVVKVKRYLKILRWKYSAKNIKFIPHGAWFTNQACVWKPENQENILFIGYIAPYKDLERLIDIIGKLRSKIPRLKLLISGCVHPNYSKEGMKILRKIINKPYVKYLGRVPNHIVPKLVSISRALILPYKTSTGTSGIYHLVAGLGLPVIAPPTPEFIELIKEDAGIMLVDFWSNEAEEKILKILTDDVLAIELSRKNIKYAMKRSWDKIAEEYLNVYHEVLAK